MPYGIERPPPPARDRTGSARRRHRARRSSSRRTSFRCGAAFSPTCYLVPRAPIARDEVLKPSTGASTRATRSSHVFTDARVPHLPARREDQQRPAGGRRARRGRAHPLGARQSRQGRGGRSRAEHEHHARTPGGTWTRCSHRRRLTPSGSIEVRGRPGRRARASASPALRAGIKKRKTGSRADRSRASRTSAPRSSRPTKSRRRRSSPRRTPRLRRRRDGARSSELRLRERLHRRARPARRARHRAPSGRLLGIRPTQVVVASTGVIGVYLPMDRLSKGLERAVKQLAHGPEACFDAAEAIMTTDHVPKLAAYAWYEDGQRHVVGGIAKGSGMIAPEHGDDACVRRHRRADVARRLQSALRDAATTLST